MKRALKLASSRAEQPHRDSHRLDALGDLLTTEDAAIRLQFVRDADGDLARGVRNFMKWANRTTKTRGRVPRLHLGSKVRWQAHVLADYLTGAAWTRRHGDTVAPTIPDRTCSSLASSALRGVR